MEKNNANEEIRILNFFSNPRWANELRLLVVQHLTAKDLLVCRLVCKDWHDSLQNEIFWKIKIPPQLLNTITGFNGDCYRFFTRGGVRLIQSLEHVKLFINPRVDHIIESVPYMRDAQFGLDLGFRYLKTKNTKFDNIDYARKFIASSLEFKCPYLATPTKYFEDAGDTYLIFDNQFEGLAEFLRTIQPHQYNEQLVTQLVRQLIQATQYLHAHGFDLLSSEGLSFCITRDHLNKIQLKLFNYAVKNSTLFTPDYYRFTSPERVRMEEFTLMTSDLFTLGSLTVYLLTGLPLYDVHPMRSLFLLGKFESYEIKDPTNELSDLAKDFILKFLQPNPADRMTLESALNHPWLTNPEPSMTPLRSAYDCLSPYLGHGSSFDD